MGTQGSENITRSSRWEGALMCQHRSRWVALFSAITPATTVTAAPSTGDNGMKCPVPVASAQAMNEAAHAPANTYPPCWSPPPRGVPASCPASPHDHSFAATSVRSEEHTSELQSRGQLV